MAAGQRWNLPTTILGVNPSDRDESITAAGSVFPLPEFASRAVTAAHVALRSPLTRLASDYPVAAAHRRNLRMLGSDIVFARRIDRGVLRDCQLVLIRFGGIVEQRFGFTAELPALYSPHSDLQLRTVNSLAEALKYLPPERESVPTDIWFVWCRDPRTLERLEDWSNPDRIFLPLLDQADDASDALAQLRAISTRIYSRDLYEERQAVSGAKFFGRQPLVRELRDGLAAGQVLGIFGMRKSGKTSLLRQLNEVLVKHEEAHGRRCAFVYQDLEHVGAPEYGHPALEVLPDLGDAAQIALKTAGMRTKEVAELPEHPGLQTFHRAIGRLLEKLEPSDLLVVALDEIENLCPPGAESAPLAAGGAEVAQLFACLRKLYQEHDNFRLVISGLSSASVEASSLYTKANPLFEAATVHFLTPFNTSETYELLNGIGRRIGLSWSEPVVASANETTSGNVFLLRRLGSKVLAELNTSRTGTAVVDDQLLRKAEKSWRQEVTPVLKDILSHIKYFYPNEMTALELVAQGHLSGAQLVSDFPQEVSRLHRLGLLRSDRGEWEPTGLLELAWGAQFPGSSLTSPEAERRSLEQLLDSGEGHTVEYKETLCHNTRQDDVPEKAIVAEVLRAVVGFWNASGGSVVIGVADDGTVPGIERDVARFKSRDKFERFLSAKLNSVMTVSHAAKVRLRYGTHGESTVCILDVPAGSEPLFSSSDALAKDVLFVRQNATTQTLAGRDLIGYCTSHWPNV